MIDDYVKKWLIKANNDLKVAENEIKLSSEDMVTEAVCFHSQQAVEKLLKAYLVTKKIEFGKTHNLEFLKVNKFVLGKLEKEEVVEEKKNEA